MPEWVTDDGLSTLLSSVHNNVSWGLGELIQRQKRVSNLLPFIHVVEIEGSLPLSGEIIISVGNEQFTVPVIDNSLALYEPVNCFAVPSMLGTNLYIVNAVYTEDYMEGAYVSESSGYLYLLPENVEGAFVSDGSFPFFHTYETTVTLAATGVYVRYLPSDFIALGKEVSVYLDGWVDAKPVSRYIHEYEDMAICGIKQKAVLVSETEILTSMELKKRGRVSIAEPEWGISSELNLGETFLSNDVPTGILNVSFEKQLKEYMLGDTTESALFWEPVYTSGYLSSVSVDLPDDFPLQMVGYRDLTIEKPLVPVISSNVWGDSVFYEATMDVLDA